MSEITKIAIFKGKQIRKTVYQNEWWFSVIDVVGALTDSSIPRRYWSDLKIKIKQEGYGELYEKIVQLKLKVPYPLSFPHSLSFPRKRESRLYV